MHVLEVIEAVAALAGTARLQVGEELLVFLIARTDHLHVDLSLVLDEEDHITMLLVLFDLFVGCLADV